MKLIIYTDGASRGNPGPASYGFTISDSSGKLLHKEGKCIGLTTNNVAEYQGALQALKFVKENFGSNDLKINFYADSKLVIEQLSGRFKIKSPHLKLIAEQVKILISELGEVVFTHVPRAKNTLADLLANKALDCAK